MPQKKAPRQNAYFFFMRDFKRREEAKGIRFPQGLKNVASLASDEWKNLPQYEKDRYKKIADDYNKSDERAQGILATGFKLKPKPPKVGTPTMVLTMKENKKIAENKYIEHLVQNMDPDQLLDYKFYLIHVNVYCKTDDNEYFPAELAMSKFTLRDGPLKVFHRFLNPGEIPMGYSYEVKMHSEKTHRIPLDIIKTNTGYLGMYQSILNFLQESNPNEIPPLYTMFDEPFHNCSMSAVKHSLKRIWETQNVEMEEDGEICEDEPYEEVFKVYSLPRLFYELKAKCSKLFNDGQPFSNTSLANIELLKDVYSFDTEIACKFHQENDNVQFCSQSYTVRWARVIRKVCCREYADADEEEDEEEEVSPEEAIPKKEKDAITVKNELPIKTEDIKNERDDRVKVEKDIKTERESRLDGRDSNLSARVKTEKDRGYSDTVRVKSEKDRGYGDVRVKTERDRGYERHSEGDRIKSERDRENEDRIKSERDRGYDDRRSHRDDDHRSRHRDERIKSEKDRGYEHRREEHSRQSKQNVPEIAIKVEKDRGYQNSISAPPGQPSTSNFIKPEREPTNTESSSSRVKTENLDGYYDSVLKTEHVDIPYTPEVKDERHVYDNSRDPRKRNVNAQPSRDPRIQNAQAQSRDPRMRATQQIPPQQPPVDVTSLPRISSYASIKQEPSDQATSSRTNPQTPSDFPCPIPIKAEKTVERSTASSRMDCLPMQIKTERPEAQLAKKNDFPLPIQIKTEKTEGSVPQSAPKDDFPRPIQIKTEKTEGSVPQSAPKDNFPRPIQIKTEKIDKSVPQSVRYDDFPQPIPIKKERPESQNMSTTVRVKTEGSSESTTRSHDCPMPMIIKEEHAPEPRSTSHDFPLSNIIKTERSASSQLLENIVKSEPSSSCETQKRKFESTSDNSAKKQRPHDIRSETVVKNEEDFDQCPPTPRRDDWCPPTPRRDQCPPTPRRDEWCPPTPRRNECPPTPRRDEYTSMRIKSEPPDTYEIKHEEVHLEYDDMHMEVEYSNAKVVKNDSNDSKASPIKVKEEPVCDDVEIKDELFHSHEDVD